MYKIEGYWDIVPQIKNVSFPLRGKMQVDLEDGRSILVDVAKFPSIKKLSLKDRQNWYKIDNGFSFVDLPISIKSLPNNEGYIIVDRYDTEYHFKYENGQLVYDRAEYKE